MAAHIALSYSRLSNFEQCPKQFHAKYIGKTYPDDSGNYAFIKGKKKHDQLDNYVKYKTGKINVSMPYDGDVLDACSIVDNLYDKGFQLTSELQLAVDKKFKQCEWFSKATMYRAIIDLLALKDDLAIAVDWKTGKKRPYEASETGQLHLTAAMVFSIWPQVQTIVAPYFFIEHKAKEQVIFQRSMMDTGLVRPFYTAFTTVNEEKEFGPKKNEYCGFCMIKKDCELW